MSNSLLRFATSQPWLLRPAVLHDLGALLARHAAGVRIGEGEIAAVVAKRDRRREPVLRGRESIGMPSCVNPRIDRAGGFDVPVSVTAGGVAVVAVDGVLAKSADMVNGASQPPGTPHAALVETLERLAGMSEGKGGPVRAAVLHIDSPGGTCFGQSDVLRAVDMLTAAMPTIGYANDEACSAAYWLAARCTEIAVSPMGIVGCIGTTWYVDDSSAEFAMAGVERTLLSSGGIKGQGTDGVPVSEDFKEHGRELSRQWTERFVESVAQGRGVPLSTAAAWADGRIWIGQRAVAAGLADKVVETLPELVASVQREADEARAA